MDVIDLAGMSADRLEALAAKAAAVAADLRKAEPSYKLALAAGITDTGYHTVRYGWVTRYTGDVVITMTDGRRWRAVGVPSRGNAEWVAKDSRIEFTPLDPAPVADTPVVATA